MIFKEVLKFDGLFPTEAAAGQNALLQRKKNMETMEQVESIKEVENGSHRQVILPFYLLYQY